MKGPLILAALAASLAADCSIGRAADLPPAAAPDSTLPFDWSGLYLGIHAGATWNTAHTGLAGAALAGSTFGNASGGVHGGYNVVLPSGVLVGVEADLSFPGVPESSDRVAMLATAGNRFIERFDYIGTLRGRLGYTAGSWLAYVTGGFAWTQSRLIREDAVEQEKTVALRPGWAAGAGLEYALGPRWTARAEYLYSHFPAARIGLASGAQWTSELERHDLRLGLSYRLGQPHALKAPDLDDLSGSRRWAVHGQTTYIGQGYPSFPARYSGANSLSPSAQAKASWTGSLFINAHLWDGGEVYFNPEFMQGFGLSDTVGAGGYPNGEAQKSNFPAPHYNTSRLFIRQTIGLGGEQETLEAGPGQLARTTDISRLTVQVGKFAVTDVFDNNAYAKDPRRDFMNWSIWAPGAFDYSADKVGLSYGATVELNHKHWALRAGYFLAGSEPDSNNFDTRLFQRGQYLVELETRYALFDRPGKLRAIAWLSSTHSGSYREAVANAITAPDIEATRRGRTKYGYVLNLEQALTDDIGAFGRWSWNNGKTEIMAFTDIDSSLSLGLSVKGGRWGRPDDVFGIAGAINALSKDHRDFLAAGGYGILVGDGALNYRQERILETYYAFALAPRLTLTANYQFIINPAYNADRGPVSVFSGRLHGSF